MGEFFHSLFSSDGLRQMVTSGGIPLPCLIIFADTGLLTGFSLPGDTLLFLAGSLCATAALHSGVCELTCTPAVSANTSTPAV